jgi:uncharacterized protein (TIGR02145 family)
VGIQDLLNSYAVVGLDIIGGSNGTIVNNQGFPYKSLISDDNSAGNGQATFSYTPVVTGRYYVVVCNQEYSTKLLGLSSTYSQVMDNDGTPYRTVTIGSQIWTAENCRKTAGNYWFSNNDSDTLLTKGLLYDWDSANANAPSGFRLPTDADWKILEASIGMSAGEVSSSGYRGTKGTALKACDPLWSSYNIGKDTFGFTAVPAGLTNGSGGWWNAADFAMFWAAPYSGSNAYARWIGGEAPGGHNVDINRVTSTNKYQGMSVRYVHN